MPWPIEWLECDSARIDITITKGATKYIKYQFLDGNKNPIDMSLFAGKAQVRDDSRNLLTEFIVTLDSDGWIILELTPEQTNSLTVDPQADKSIIGRYDVLITDNVGRKISPFWGTVSLDYLETEV